MRKIDDFFIDKIFQPTADRLRQTASCYSFAFFLLVTFLLENVQYCVQTEKLVNLAATFIWAPLFLLRIYKLDQQPVRNIIPAERISMFFTRMLMSLMIVPFSVIASFATPGLRDKISEIAWVLVWFVVYLMACIKRPPMRKKSKALNFPLDAVGLLR